MDNFLLGGERLLNQSSNNIVVLTTHRIRFNDTNSSHAHLVSIMLEKVSSCEVRYQSWPVVLVLGVVLGLFGGFALLQRGSGQEVGILALVLGLVFIIAYFTSRKHIISISSDGGARIGFETKGLKREAVVTFVNEIEKAKNQRVLQLGGVSVSPPY